MGVTSTFHSGDIASSYINKASGQEQVSQQKQSDVLREF